jgi:CHC2 zinc finger
MKIDYRELRQRVRLADLLTQIGWQSTKGRGAQLRGPCPLPACCDKFQDAPSRGHSVRDLSTFSVHTTKNIYRCFRCRAAGNVLDFWRTYRAISLHAAAAELSHSETRNHESS